MERENFSSGTPWEPRIGYSRAVRVGPQVFVSGTTAMNEEGMVVGVGDPYTQTVETIQNIQSALLSAGGTLSDVVMTRMYVTDMEAHGEIVGEAHGEFFGTVRPATAIVEVARLFDPDMLVEIEARALLDDPV